MDFSWNLKAKLFNEYLENGGYEKLNDPELIDDLLKVKALPNGEIDIETLTPMVRATINAYAYTQLMDPFLSDEIISEYQTLLQKEIFFEQVTIETEEEFDKIFEDFKDKKETLFRGLNEAKYRLYSSLQRDWVLNKMHEKFSYQDFLKALVQNAREQLNGTLSNYLDTTNFDSGNDLAILALLQHHGCPTPLLDWTYSFKNALFFATENIQPSDSRWEIEYYFCVYYLEEEHFNQNTIKEIVSEGFEKYDDELRERFFKILSARGLNVETIKEILPKEMIDEMARYYQSDSIIKYMTKIERLLSLNLLYFSDNDPRYSLAFMLNNNMNIINQQGVFTWNSSPSRPLEFIANEEYQKENDDNNYKFSKCININKKLSGYVREKLSEFGISSEFIYPNPYKIAKDTYNATI